MKTFIVVCSVISIVYCKTLVQSRHFRSDEDATGRCLNMWDEGCINGQLNGAGNDDDYLNGGFNPGKRYVNPGNYDYDDYLNGGFNPGTRPLHDLLRKLQKNIYLQ